MRKINYKYRNLNPRSKFKLIEIIKIRRSRNSKCFHFTVVYYYNHLSQLYIQMRKLKISKLRRLNRS